MAWARSRREVAVYLGFYASRFLPSGESNRDAWKKKRMAALARTAGIFIDIDDLKFTLSDATHATMVITQTYRFCRDNGRWPKRVVLKII